MIDFNSIKTILKVAGITHLKISFDEKQHLVNVDYVFRGVPGTKQMTYQEIIDNLSIGVPDMSLAQRAGCVVDFNDELE